MWLVTGMVLLAKSSCLFLDDHCYLGDESRVTCLLQGDSIPEEPSVASILSQTLKTEEENHKGCPTLDLNRNQRLELYLLPCEGMFKNVKGNIDQILKEDRQLPETVTSIPDQCNQSQFTINHALLDDIGSVAFKGGIHIKNTALVDYAEHHYDIRPMIKRGAGSFQNDKTCNVINNGMYGVIVQGLELNNEECVDTEVPESNLKNALTDYGPDQLSVVRVTNIFQKSNSIEPTGFMIKDVTFRTSNRYREAYPGRALMEVDNVKSTTYPALPINAEGDLFGNLIDLYQKDKSGPIFVDPFYNNSNGTLVFNSTIYAEDRVASMPIDLILW